jgi:hypothetical protein
MAPFYSYLIYFSFKLFGLGNWWPIQLFQALLLSIIPLLLLQIRKYLFPDRPDLSWGILLLPLIFPFSMYSAYIGPAAILTVIVTTGFYLLFLAVKNPRWSYIIGFGVLAGISTLIDPVPAILFVLGFLWLLVRLRSRVVIPCIIGCFLALLIVSPWLYRNYKLFKAFPLIKNQFGLILWWGNNPLATGGIHNPDGGVYTAHFDALNAAEKDSLSHWDEWKRDCFFGHKAFTAIRNWIRTNPIGYFKLKFKSLLFFWFGEAWNIDIKKTLTMRSADPKLAIFFILTLIPSFFLLFLSIVGIIIGLINEKYRTNTILVLLVLLAWTATYTITHGHTFNRYRVPLDPILLMFSLLGLSFILGKNPKHNIRE